MNGKIGRRPGPWALAAFVACHALAAQAVDVSAGPADEVVWEQTQPFSLGQAGGTIWWYEGWGLPAPVSSSFSGSVAFLASPAGFTIAGTRYALTTVTATFSSTLAGTSKTYCHDTDIWSHCESFGAFRTTVAASFETVPAPVVSAVNNWDSSATGEGYWCCIGVIPIGTAANTTASHAATAYPAAVKSYRGEELPFFQQPKQIRLNLVKNITIAMTGVQSNDTDAYIQETSNAWDGSVKLQYRFAAVAVPEPATAVLFGLGLAAFGALRRRA